MSWFMPACNYLSLIFLLLHCFDNISGSYRVHGPSEPIVAVAGDDVTLPCHVAPKINAEQMTVEWTKLVHMSESPKGYQFIHVLQEGRLANYHQNLNYRGRTSLFSLELHKGDVSLKLSKVKVCDEGKYRCFLPRLDNAQREDKETTIQLAVVVLSQPVVSIVGIINKSVNLSCESSGWPLKPEVSWLDSDGNIPSVGATKTDKNTEGFYTVRRNVTVVQTATNRFTCRIQQKEMNHIRETDIHVPDGFLALPQRSSCLQWGLVGGLVAGLLGGLAVSFIMILLRAAVATKTNDTRGEPILPITYLGNQDHVHHEVHQLRNQVGELLREIDELRETKASRNAVGKAPAVHVSSQPVSVLSSISENKRSLSVSSNTSENKRSLSVSSNTSTTSTTSPKPSSSKGFSKQPKARQRLQKQLPSSSWPNLQLSNRYSPLRLEEDQPPSPTQEEDPGLLMKSKSK